MEPFPQFSGGNEGKWYIMATTPCRVYQFIGQVQPRLEPQFMELFSFYSDSVKSKIPNVLMYLYKYNIMYVM